ncbi:tail completion protein gp17 [Oxalicibacterium faecigallinarum]|uniref:DUF3168 domain-containing protein n=1 Tax=Oxalicibacterium faecigallinarum TaxID=573741 RepID=A0A8J3F0Z7_9BURK|nr:DUF3168 domain-containing protein [Oxalicibacterium faecigallinarum]GGI16444.1 hypothetical protein GCM10008066_03990 [Oxalicibacterium faecigallinarum]
MSVEAKITTALSAIDELALPDGEAAVYQDDFPQPEKGEPKWPAVRFTLMPGEVHADISGDGDEDTDDIRVQIDVVSKTPKERRVIWDKVRAAMKKIDPPALLQAPPDMSRDLETKTYRAMGDWVIYGSSE